MTGHVTLPCEIDIFILTLLGQLCMFSWCSAGVHNLIALTGCTTIFSSFEVLPLVNLILLDFCKFLKN